MKNFGAEEFQKKREDILCNLIHKGCELLLIEEISIHEKSVHKKISYFFIEEKINKKYFVKQQSIGRNPVYRKIWNYYQKKQQIIPRKGSKKYIELDACEVRDKLDILQQEYIEIEDENKFLQQQCMRLKMDLEALSKLSENGTLKLGTEPNNILSAIPESTNFLKLINNILTNGPVAIVKIDDEIIIKNYKNSNQERVAIPINEWVMSYE